MEEGKKITKKATKNTSEVSKTKKVSTKKVKATELDNDALLEQIMNKKNTKKSAKKSNNETKKVSSVEKKSSTEKSDSKKEEKLLVNKKSDSKELEIKNEIVPENIIDDKNKNEKKDVTVESNTEQVKSKKKKKKKKKNKNVNNVNEETKAELTAEVKDEELKEAKVQVDEFETTSEEIENVVEEDNSNAIVENEDTIITRELNFSADSFDIKNKKMLNELRDAIKEYDSLDEADKSDVVQENNLSTNNSIDDIVEEDKSKTALEDTFVDEVKVVTEKRSQKYLFGDVEEDYNTWQMSVIKDNIDGEEIKELNGEDKYEEDLLKYDNDDTQKKLLIFGCILLGIVLSFVLYFYFSNAMTIDGSNVNATKNAEKIKAEKEALLKIEYEECLNASVNESDDTEKIKEMKKDLSNFFSTNFNASVYYEDLTNGFSYGHNLDYEYYAASTIKMLDAIYLYEKAINGEIDLDTKLKYTRAFSYGGSAILNEVSFGTEISLRDLVKYAITVSDNSAHQMLVSYITKSELQKYGMSLGATKSFVGTDNFGAINPSDAAVYLKKLNELINNGGELGQELKSYFEQSDYNDFKMDDLGITSAYKYGYYNEYYHSIGIVYDEKPFILVVLTREGRNEYRAIVQEIRNKIYKLHKANYDNRVDVCKMKVYGN